MEKLSDVVAEANRESINQHVVTMSGQSSIGNASLVAKAKFLFKWMCTEVVSCNYGKAIDALTATAPLSDDGDMRIETFIVLLLNGRTTYATAFSRLCALAGIECHTVYGTLRGVGLRSAQSQNSRSQSISSTKIATHSWSLLKINENRRVLVCCQCAVQKAAPINLTSRCMSASMSSIENVIAVDEFYFQTDPELFAYTHMPTESESSGQVGDILTLLDRSFTQVDFDAAPLVTSAFFALGLEFNEACRRSSFVISDTNEFLLKLEWKSDDEAKKASEFRDFRFVFETAETPSECSLDDEQSAPVPPSRSDLRDHCLFEISERGLSFWLRFPENGFYQFVVLAAIDRNEHLNGNGQRRGSFVVPTANDPIMNRRRSSLYLVPQSKPGSQFVPLCEWLIEVDRAPLKYPPKPFPKCQAAQNWGLPPKLANRFGVSNASGRFSSRIFAEDDGIAELYLQLSKPCILSAKLKRHEDGSNYASGATVFHRVVKNVAVFTVSIPLEDNPGELGLEIFANDPAVDQKTLYGFAQFLIVGPAKSPGEPDLSVSQLSLFPASASNILGAHQNCSDLGLSPKSHPDPLTAVCSPKELEIQFNTTESVPLRMGISMYLCKNGPNGQVLLTDTSLYALYQTISQTSVSIICRFPVKGVYKLQIFAARSGSSSDALPVVFTYAIFVNVPTAGCLPFPKQLLSWQGGFLIEPRNGLLKSDCKAENSCTFKLMLPKARKVAVVIRSQPKERFALLNSFQQPDDPQKSWWEGVLALDSGKITEVAIVANFGTEKDDTSYNTLLIYNNQEILQLQ